MKYIQLRKEKRIIEKEICSWDNVDTAPDKYGNVSI
jgi:hypothetical protein